MVKRIVGPDADLGFQRFPTRFFFDSGYKQYTYLLTVPLSFGCTLFIVLYQVHAYTIIFIRYIPVKKITQVLDGFFVEPDGRTRFMMPPPEAFHIVDISLCLFGRNYIGHADNSIAEIQGVDQCVTYVKRK